MNYINGGYWEFIMHGPDGTDYKNKIQYTEINKPHSLHYKHVGVSSIEPDVFFETKVRFDKSGNGTLLTMEQIFPSKEELERVNKEFGAVEGGKQHLGNLEKHLDHIQSRY